MSVERAALKKTMSSKTNEELYYILHAHPGEYTPDAVEIADEEFRRRKLDAPALSSLGTAIEDLRAQEEAPLGWPLRVVAFFFSTALMGIPVILAHRHFVEHGARRKAREWARWALFGLGFYLGLFVLGLVLPRL